MELIDTVFLIAIIAFSAIIHEVMHGVAADKLGDPTARYAGRLTLNPIPHIDMFGSIILPTILAISNSPIFFAWAKPVPYNLYNLRPGRFSEAIVAGAGPFSNLVIALIGGLMIRLNIVSPINDIVFLIVVTNVMLCIFNLIPVPPLDGSKVFEALLPRSLAYGYSNWRARMETNPLLGMGAILLLVLLLGSSLGAFIYALANAIAGM
ncbi:MAG: site-2 protease family protein [Patescibacteria group bacterium]